MLAIVDQLHQGLGKIGPICYFTRGIVLHGIVNFVEANCSLYLQLVITSTKSNMIWFYNKFS